MTPDGTGGAVVVGHGPTALWTTIEDAYTFWVEHDRPGWTRFGLSIQEDHQFVWLDDETSRIRQW